MTVGYNNFDVYLRYKIEGYTSFTASQQAIIRHEVADYMAWHRHHALPEYIIFLKDVELLSQQSQPLSITDIARLRARANKLYVASILPAITPAANILSDLNDQQITSLENNLAADNLKLKQELLGDSIEKMLEKRAQRTLDFIENMVGNLDAAQTEKIRALNIRLPFTTEIFIRQRVASQTELIRRLRNKDSAEKISDFLTSLLLVPEFTRTADEQVLMGQLKAASDDLIEKSYALLNSEQKQTLQKNIARYIEDFQKLHHAAQSNSTR